MREHLVHVRDLVSAVEQSMATEESTDGDKNRGGQADQPAT
jgi:hypothetical protein